MKKHYQKTALFSKIAARAITNKILPPKKGVPRSEFGISLMIARGISKWLKGDK